ncbi:MAG: LysE family transporter, partial [Sulfitobacter sp.]|nr:LysE family transporter [Sulfitobacter sp.]
MNAESLIAFNLVLLAALASPGAALLYFIKTTVSSGHLAGFVTGLGLGTAAAGWTLAALLGLESVFALFPWAYASLKTAGALYLMWLAYQTWCRARDAVTEAAPHSGRSFGAGFLVNLGNPKSMLFAAAVIVVVFPQGLAGSQIALIALNHLLLEVAFYGLLVALLGAP